MYFRFFRSTILPLLILTFHTSQGQEMPEVVAKGATPVLVSSDFQFTEGPAVDASGNVYFTDQPNDRIMKWSPRDGLSVFMEGTGRSNGLYFDRDGNLISCADLDNQLWSIAPDKSVTVLVRDFEGKKLNGPNDVWVHPNGGIYFTDPFYRRNYWDRTEKEIENEDVYYLAPDRKTLKVAATGIVKPNGLIGSPDGKTLYVTDIGDRKTYVFDIAADGSLSNRRLFVEMGADGMTMDSKGNIYLAGRGVTVFSPKGEKLGVIPIPENWTANVCFGGKDLKTLFVTASKSVYTVKMRVKGIR
ncbi:MAG TPA: SMP-30/gluconolactonase/LRE family protein [Cyclobacteriaceae bacterium]|nr:SMP-30/gluconolactonase/LRE family protein [Cyclobacteriaceae bacterium]